MSAPYYQDDLVTLYHADALDVLGEIEPRTVDTVLTDPPYSSGGRRENARSIRKSMTRSTSDEDWIAGDSMSTAGFVWTMRAVAARSRATMKLGGHFLSFIDWRMYPNLAVALESADLRQHPTLVWDKTQIGMGSVFRNRHEWICHFTAGNGSPPQRRDVGNVIPCPPVRDGQHPTQKPIPLLRTLISVVCPAGGTVLDPFAGSGSTGVAALIEGRRFIGVEMTEHYARVAAAGLHTAAMRPSTAAQSDIFGELAS